MKSNAKLFHSEAKSGKQEKVLLLEHKGGILCDLHSIIFINKNQICNKRIHHSRHEKCKLQAKELQRQPPGKAQKISCPQNFQEERLARKSLFHLQAVWLLLEG